MELEDFILKYVLLLLIYTCFIHWGCGIGWIKSGFVSLGMVASLIVVLNYE